MWGKGKLVNDWNYSKVKEESSKEPGTGNCVYDKLTHGKKISRQ